MGKNETNYILGHSMGGALAVHTALTDQICGLIGLVVIDVVEGTAMDALSSMQSFLRGRPKTFPSLEYAIEWSQRTGQVRNSEAARVSMAGQLKNSINGQCAVHETTDQETSDVSKGQPFLYNICFAPKFSIYRRFDKVLPNQDFQLQLTMLSRRRTRLARPRNQNSSSLQLTKAVLTVQ